MKKKTTIRILSTLFLSISLGVVACGGNGGQQGHTHTFSSEWTYDDTYHWHEATCGHDVISDRAEHSYDNWVIDQEPTTDKSGHKHRDCLICDYVQEEDIDPSQKVLANRVYFNYSSFSLITNNLYTLNPVVFPNNAVKNVKYEISNNNILSIVDNEVTGNNSGSTIVYGYNDNNNNNLRDSDEPYQALAFTVTEADPNISLIIQESATLAVGETLKIEYSLKGASAQGFDYGFYSEDKSICSFSAGNLVGHKPGHTRIYVTWKGYKAYCSVDVTDLTDSQGLRASEILINDDCIVINKNDVAQIRYQVKPLNSVDSVNKFTSNNQRVAKVDNNGNVTGLDGGSAIITLESTNHITSSILVIVRNDRNDSNSYYNNYYGDLAWENGADLKEKLHNIITKNVNHIKYKKGNSSNWESNQNADQDLFDWAYVKTVYNDDPILKASTTTWQREHAFAASLMTGFSTGGAVCSEGRATDFHNLFASHGGANGSRGNKNFGYVNPNSAELTTKENCLYTKDAWEPNNVDKGRLARAVFYMGVMYSTTESTDSIQEKWTFRGDDIAAHTTASKTLNISGNELPLQIVEDNIDYNKVSLDEFMMPSKNENSVLVEYYRNLVREENPNLETSDYDLFRQKAYEKYTDASMPYAIGHLSDLIKWNSFEVDLLEMQHNQSVYGYDASSWGGAQGNRNPFVDYPQLVDYVYGDLINEPGSLKNLTPSCLSLKMDKDEINHYSIDSSKIKTFVVGDKPNVDDFDIKAIKNDLSEGTLDKAKIHVEDYTFVESDVTNGKEITIQTDINNIIVKVKVASGSELTFEDCNYQFIAASSKPQDQYVKVDETHYTLTSGGITFNVETQNPISISASGGAKFGTAGSSVGTLTFETSEAVTISNKNIINAVCLRVGASAAANIYTYSIYVGDQLLGTDNFNGTSVRDICVKDDNSRNLSGKVKIVFSNVVTYIVIKGIAINAI